MGLTGSWAGHTAGGCVFAQQAQASSCASFFLGPQISNPLLGVGWGSAVRAHSPLPGIQGLGAQLYPSSAVWLFMVLLVGFLSTGCPWARPALGAQARPPACVCSCTLRFGSHSGRHVCTIWSRQHGGAVSIPLRAWWVPECVLADGQLPAVCCPQALWLRKDRPHSGDQVKPVSSPPLLSSCLYYSRILLLLYFLLLLKILTRGQYCPEGLFFVPSLSPPECVPWG